MGKQLSFALCGFFVVVLGETLFGCSDSALIEPPPTPLSVVLSCDLSDLENYDYYLLDGERLECIAGTEIDTVRFDGLKHFAGAIRLWNVGSGVAIVLDESILHPVLYHIDLGSETMAPVPNIEGDLLDAYFHDTLRRMYALSYVVESNGEITTHVNVLAEDYSLIQRHSFQFEDERYLVQDLDVNNVGDAVYASYVRLIPTVGGGLINEDTSSVALFDLSNDHVTKINTSAPTLVKTILYDDQNDAILLSDTGEGNVYIIRANGQEEVLLDFGAPPDASTSRRLTYNSSTDTYFTNDHDGVNTAVYEYDGSGTMRATHQVEGVYRHIDSSRDNVLCLRRFDAEWVFTGGEPPPEVYTRFAATDFSLIATDTIYVDDEFYHLASFKCG